MCAIVIGIGIGIEIGVSATRQVHLFPSSETNFFSVFIIE